MHSMGLSYNKANEGSLYPDVVGPGSQSTPQPGAAVPPGGCFTYKWLVSNDSAPAPGSPSHFWSYHPFVNMRADIYTGLQGPLIVYRSGGMNETMASHREFIMMYETVEETASWLSVENAAMYGGNDSIAGYRSNRPMPRVNGSYGNSRYLLNGIFISARFADILVAFGCRSSSTSPPSS